MTLQVIERDQLGKVLRSKVYQCQREALPWLMQILDELDIPYDSEKIAHQRRQVWLCRKARNQRKRAEIQYGLNDHFTPEQLGRLIDYYGESCVCCGSDDNVTVDHILPLSMGGSNTIDNIQITCYRCNSERARMGASDDRRNSWPLWFGDVLNTKNLSAKGIENNV